MIKSSACTKIFEFDRIKGSKDRNENIYVQKENKFCGLYSKRSVS